MIDKLRTKLAWERANDISHEFIRAPYKRTFHIVSIRFFEHNVYLHAKLIFEVTAKETST